MFPRTVADRFPVIEPFIRQGDVLDLGCVDSRPARETAARRIGHKPNLLFRRLVEINPATLGVDIDAEGVQVLRTMGYQAECADVQTMDLGRRFDTIIAGELIEHLENPGLFLRNMRRHLKDDGVLIISTPNPFYQNQVWKIWRYGRPAVHEDHTNWQDPITLRHLLARAGFDTFDGCWIQPGRGLLKTWKQRFRGYFSHGFLILARPARTASPTMT
jgi:2-polyprenyl-3-methyl-5-hydroxy-6-metoxy-1,4-benzoquinol methylase